MHTQYLGLELCSPVVVASSPYTAALPAIRRCAAAGAGAVVLKSIFEEQILHEATALAHFSDSPYGDADTYLERYLGDDYRGRFLRLVSSAREAVPIPVIASINCVAENASWVEYAVQMAEAGASALELNIFLQPYDRFTPARELEGRYAAIAGRVVQAVRIPVSVKLPMRLTNLFATADILRSQRVQGAVLFNRFFEPDVDIERLEFIGSSPYSEPSELRNLLRTAALFTGLVPQLDLALSTGVHDGTALVKALLCGAKVAQVCTAIHLHGFRAIGRMNDFLERWAERHNFSAVEEFRGHLNFVNTSSPLFQRVQYMKYFPSQE